MTSTVIRVSVDAGTTMASADRFPEGCPPGLVVETPGVCLRLLPAYGLSADEVSAVSAAMASAVAAWLSDLTRYAGELRAAEEAAA